MPLHVRRAGDGPPVILIHGLFGSLENLGAIARQLAERFCVYSIDLPNHGRSPHSDDTSLAHMCTLVFQWLERQPFSSCSLVGHSLGGKVAMEFALTYPEKIEKLAVLDISPVKYSAHHNRVFEGLLSLEPDRLKNRAEADAFLAAYVEELSVRSFLLKNLIKQEHGYGWRMNLTTLHNSYERLIDGNRENAVFLGETLFMKGSRSNYIEDAHKQAIVSRFPKAQLKIVADTGHWLHAEKPDLVARLLRRFLE